MSEEWPWRKNKSVEMNRRQRKTGVVVREFWSPRCIKEYEAVSIVRAGTYVKSSPQSMVRTGGVRDVALLESEYRTRGQWTYTMGRVLGDACEGESGVVADGWGGAVKARGLLVWRFLERYAGGRCQPAGRSGMTGQVPASGLCGAGAVESFTMNFAGSAGPALGGFVVASVSPKAAFVLSAMSYAG
ncbi:MFS transporter, partial [Burkholderia thailandensis]